MDKSITELVQNEAHSWDRIQEIRASFSPDLFGSVPVLPREEALQRSARAVQSILNHAKTAGVDTSKIEPGHGQGHLVRDYINALILLSRLQAPTADLQIGFLGGVLHDAGCALIPRYLEQTRAVRHAEVGALALDYIARNFPCGLTPDEITLAAYSVAAHTNYLKPTEVKCADGVTRKIEPYADLANGNPILGVWIPRWVGRLDCSGPTFVGRHFLTLAEVHKDFDGKNFYDVAFDSHMNPVIRSPEELKAAGGKRTMLEHMKMFADSQVNTSVYGKHDFGEMTTIRDEHRDQLMRIISAAQDRTTLSPQEEDKILQAWNVFLKCNVEPTELGAKTADVLDQMFKALPSEHRHPWVNAFKVTLQEYEQWAKSKLVALSELKAGYNLPGICDDVRKLIVPAYK